MLKLGAGGLGFAVLGLIVVFFDPERKLQNPLSNRHQLFILPSVPGAGCRVSCYDEGRGQWDQPVQGTSPMRNRPPHRTIQKDYAQAPMVVLGGGAVSMSEVTLALKYKRSALNGTPPSRY